MFEVNYHTYLSIIFSLNMYSIVYWFKILRRSRWSCWEYGLSVFIKVIFLSSIFLSEWVEDILLRYCLSVLSFFRYAYVWEIARREPRFLFRIAFLGAYGLILASIPSSFPSICMYTEKAYSRVYFPMMTHPLARILLLFVFYFIH